MATTTSTSISVNPARALAKRGAFAAGLRLLPLKTSQFGAADSMSPSRDEAKRPDVSVLPTEQTVMCVQPPTGCRRQPCWAAIGEGYGQRCPVGWTRARPLLASTTSSASWPGLQMTNVPICGAPESILAWPRLVYDT